jgi:two-component system chemotaxis response regulator CheY
MFDDRYDEPQVLVVDDVPATRELLCDMLKEMGFSEIAEAVDGRDALEKLKKHRAQLIICDQVMEDMSGLDLLYQIRNHPYLVDIPFVVVSSCGDVPVIDTALELGADDYIMKPISFRLFKKKIFDTLRRRAERLHNAG